MHAPQILTLGLATAACSTAASVFGPIRDRLQQTLGFAAERSLIELSPGETRWVTDEEKWALRRDGKRFFDITFTQDFDSSVPIATKTKFPDRVAHNKTIGPLLQELEKDNMRSHLQTFTAFHTRYYKSDYGRQSSEWLFEQVNKTLSEAGAGKAQFFKHSWGQKSIIATIPGKSDKTVVIGAHQDSINLFLPSILAAPGADDDGSGTVTILEALRVLLKDKDVAAGKAANTVEFHWYSAEEGGLLGSQAIFSSYQKQERDVKAMLQQDMTGLNAKAQGVPEAMGVITDFVDPGLTAFIKKVITAYCTIPYVETKCGYACSDHASASKAGYPSAFVIESDFQHSNKRIHTTDDKLEYLDFGHMLQHARMTLALAYELAFADL